MPEAVTLAKVIDSRSQKSQEKQRVQVRLEDLAFDVLESGVRFVATTTREGIETLWQPLNTPEKAGQMLMLSAVATAIAIECPVLLLVPAVPVVGKMVYDRGSEFFSLASGEKLQGESSPYISEHWGKFVGRTVADAVQVVAGFSVSPGLKKLSLPKLKFPFDSLNGKALENLPSGWTPDGFYFPFPPKFADDHAFVVGKGGRESPTSTGGSRYHASGGGLERLVGALRSLGEHANSGLFAARIEGADVDAHTLVEVFARLGFEYRTVLDNCIPLLQNYSTAEIAILRNALGGLAIHQIRAADSDSAMAIGRNIAENYLKRENLEGAWNELSTILLEGGRHLPRFNPILRRIIEIGGIEERLLSRRSSFQTDLHKEFLARYFVRNLTRLPEEKRLETVVGFLRSYEFNPPANGESKSRYAVFVARMIEQLSEESVNKLLEAIKYQNYDSSKLQVRTGNAIPFYLGLAMCAHKGVRAASAVFGDNTNSWTTTLRKRAVEDSLTLLKTVRGGITQEGGKRQSDTVTVDDWMEQRLGDTISYLRGLASSSR